MTTCPDAAQTDVAVAVPPAAMPDDPFLQAPRACEAPAPAQGQHQAPVVVAASLTALAAEARRLTAQAAFDAEAAERAAREATAARIREEQHRLYEEIMRGLPEAVRRAACEGRACVDLLSFQGVQRYDEFTYLYMLKGPVTPQERADMKAMGLKPLMARLRRELTPAGFRLRHDWDRATHENTLTVSW